MSRPIALLAAACLLAGALCLAPPGWADDAPAEPTPGFSGVLEELRSPAARDREAAVRRLIDLLPETRDPVLEALPSAPPEVKIHLVDVLAADASPPAIRALLETMNAGDARLAARIRSRLARSEVATRKVLDAWKEHPALRQDGTGSVTPRTRALEMLLRRAEAERIFLGRKSKTGSTGSYRGQYDVLRPYRIEALDICVGLFTDHAIPEPGVVNVGNFEFLRPSPVHIDIEELRGMAAHAFAELATPKDVFHLLKMTNHLPTIEERLSRGDTNNPEFREALNDYADLLVALYLVRPDRFQNRVDEFLKKMRVRYGWGDALDRGSTFVAMILLRIGRYRDAIQAFEMLQYTSLSQAGTHYNLACAYAQWAEHTEAGLARDAMLRSALDHLEKAVDSKWSDIGWMEEDLDLAPIRDTARYKELVRRVHRRLALPEDR